MADLAHGRRCELEHQLARLVTRGEFPADLVAVLAELEALDQSATDETTSSPAPEAPDEHGSSTGGPDPADVAQDSPTAGAAKHSADHAFPMHPGSGVPLTHGGDPFWSEPTVGDVLRCRRGDQR